MKIRQILYNFFVGLCFIGILYMSYGLGQSFADSFADSLAAPTAIPSTAKVDFVHNDNVYKYIKKFPSEVIGVSFVLQGLQYTCNIVPRDEVTEIHNCSVSISQETGMGECIFDYEKKGAMCGPPGSLKFN